ncbi:MAG: PhoH family protein, partial [Rhodoferax sp.]
MPLPTAPTKRAALLSEQDYDVPARTQPKARKTDSLLTERPVSEKPQAREIPLHTDAAGQVVAFMEKSAPEGRAKTPRSDTSARKLRPEVKIAIAGSAAKKTKHNGPSKL